jgi:predicted DNA-binding ribbon-helix-helix protein
MLKSPIVKRSILVNGHKTSVSLEDEFWSALKIIAGKRFMKLQDLVTAIDKQRQHSNLSHRLLSDERRKSERASDTLALR